MSEVGRACQQHLKGALVFRVTFSNGFVADAPVAPVCIAAKTSELTFITTRIKGSMNEALDGGCGGVLFGPATGGVSLIQQHLPDPKADINKNHRG